MMLWDSGRRPSMRETAPFRATAHRLTSELATLVEPFAASSLPLLVCGEVGVGKSSYVDALLKRSPRAHSSVVRLSARALPSEEELFGVETADSRGGRLVEGQLAKADGGVLVIEDVDDLPDGVSQRFVRLVQDGELSPVNSALTRRVDLRLVATCSSQPAGHVRPAAHAEVHRLFPLTVTVPPLRRRVDDVEALARHFARGASGGVAEAGLTREAVAKLRAHSWPGNAHELRTVVEAAVRTANGGLIDATHLALVTRPADVDGAAERERLLSALAAGAWNQSRAAEILGVSRRTVIRKMLRFGIPRPRKQ